jgi:NAD(P)H-dependent flavin oxidoreductase YrpB (nitropropane dioxygenase family)
VDFIFMLTNHDRTVSDAFAVLEEVKATGLTHVGFKDVGATPEQQRALAESAHAAGMTVYLEVVSTSAQAELTSVEAGRAAGVDWILGGTNPELALPLLKDSGVSYAPFPGTIVGHPSVLEGSIEEIAAHAARLTALDGVTGVDLLAYRHQEVDPLELTKAVVASSAGPVIAAGSVVTREQIVGLKKAGASAFTIGGAIFDDRLPGDGVAAQVRTALDWARQA